MHNDIFSKNIFMILPGFEEQRIDNFLHNKLKGVPRSMIYRILRTGAVRINKKRVKPWYKLQIGDEIYVPLIRTIRSKDANLSKKMAVVTALEDAIIYEDEYIIGLNKPSGIAVHGGSGLQYGVIEALRSLRPATEFLELVHRLDRDTSGVLLLAKKRSSLRMLHEQLRENSMEKNYLALVQGRWPMHIKIVDAPLLKTIQCNHQSKVRVHQNGKPSKTLFQIKENYAHIATLVKASLVTGRMHQIRAHALHIGHPIILDNLYGNSDFSKHFKGIGLQRLFLHAATLSFIHPHTKKIILISAPLDKQLNNCLKRLRFSATPVKCNQFNCFL
ncbi:23S rRNA pseudouridine(955/2504/2580) synthase RluC [Candidatus Erwinia haradaeae]|uniref:Pseudouridine synthase n=1 Tax=Candidatus Erwinia haradaeae TaxID=1922217 RepID=A0A451D373_9GAMM|nr:23S rRNA pseudouridine(955/2504/2580) synthase RluC [Candidatus Erwinia haradaeae]VFP80101.1 Ribosomal large subunit pseudouridine synthase C [Candidatus Erwinia haradaeae]